MVFVASFCALPDNQNVIIYSIHTVLYDHHHHHHPEEQLEATKHGYSSNIQRKLIYWFKFEWSWNCTHPSPNRIVWYNSISKFHSNIDQYIHLIYIRYNIYIYIYNFISFSKRERKAKWKQMFLFCLFLTQIYSFSYFLFLLFLSNTLYNWYLIMRYNTNTNNSTTTNCGNSIVGGPSGPI